jgi:hypothetical protein
VALLGRIWILHVVCFSWILFRSGRMETVNAMLRSLGSWRATVPEVATWSALSVAMVLVGFATQFLDGARLWRAARKVSAWPAWALATAAALALTAMLALGPEDVAPFIYFQF